MLASRVDRSPNLANSTCRRTLCEDGSLLEVIHLDGDRADLSDADLERFVAGFPITTAAGTVPPQIARFRASGRSSARRDDFRNCSHDHLRGVAGRNLRADPARHCIRSDRGTVSRIDLVAPRFLYTENRMTEVATPVLLFSYGTLRDKKVQLANFGRELTGRDDSLPGYRPVTLFTGESEYTNLELSSNPEDAVEGTAFEVTGQELYAADRYEEPTGYHRIQVTLRSGDRAWVYLHA